MKNEYTVVDITEEKVKSKNNKLVGEKKNNIYSQTLK